MKIQLRQRRDLAVREIHPKVCTFIDSLERKNEEVYKDSPPSPQKPSAPPKPNLEVSPKKVNPPRQRKPYAYSNIVNL